MDFLTKTTRYIADSLGMSVALSAQTLLVNIPRYLTDLYSIHEIILHGRNFYTLIPKTSEDPIPSLLKKHCTTLEGLLKQPVIYLSATMTAYTRKQCVRLNIQFVVPYKQLYIPMLALDMTERFTPVKTTRNILGPATQAVVCVMFLSPHNQMTLQIDTCAQALNYTTMTISRAFDEIEALIPDMIQKRGRERLLMMPKNRHAVWETLEPVLKTPVLNRIYLMEKPKGVTLIKSGLTATAHYTNIADTLYEVYAVHHSFIKSIKKENEGIIIPVAEPHAITVETWRYDPIPLSRNGYVDQLSLYLSLRNDDNERIQAACTSLIGGIL